jgi:hypothetical protein
MPPPLCQNRYWNAKFTNQLICEAELRNEGDKLDFRVWPDENGLLGRYDINEND